MGETIQVQQDLLADSNAAQQQLQAEVERARNDAALSHYSDVEELKIELDSTRKALRALEAEAAQVKAREREQSIDKDAMHNLQLELNDTKHAIKVHEQVWGEKP